ncbi:DsbC family protein [Asaia bogorensis]|uniref:DsbC family protein n=1 Tax=Asaia bogorensis TaxID=91915 RepID=UPI003015CCAE
MRTLQIIGLAVLFCPLPALAQQCAAPPALAHIPAQSGALPPLLSPGAIQSSAALQRLASHGAELRDLGVSHGLQGVFAQNGKQFRVFYLTPDGTAEIGGVMWDEAGRNVTRDQVATIPGVIPTVTWTPSKATAGDLGKGGGSVDPVARLAAADYGLVGREGAPRVYMVIDPLCPYSQQAMQSLQGAIQSGRIQVALVPIAINDYENGNRSTPAADMLISAGSQKMGAAWQQIMAGGKGVADTRIDPTAPAQLVSNMAAAHAISIRGTPTVAWRDHEGHSHTQAGLPDDLETFLKAIAS